MRHPALLAVLLVVLGFCATAARAQEPVDRQLFSKSILDIGCLPPNDSLIKVRVGRKIPDFDLPKVGGGRLRLSSYLGKKNVVLSFIPAAWTPVCSGQWPGYNIAREVFEAHDAVLVGLSADNVPSLFAWITQMGGVWFDVVSDFWPHGGYAKRLGILRSDGVSERAVLLVDKQGVIRYIDVHDINQRPDMGVLIEEMAKVSGNKAL